MLAGDAGEQVLVGLAGQQVAVVQGGLAEIGEQAVAAAVDVDADAAFGLQSVQHGLLPLIIAARYPFLGGPDRP